MATPSTTPSPFADRLDRVRARLQESGCDYCLVGPSSDLRYLTGLDLHASERLAVLIVAAAGGATLVVPSFEVHGLGTLPSGMDVAAWQESDNPAQLAAGFLAPGGGTTCVAVGDQLLAVFLLRLQAALPQVAFRTAEDVLVPVRMVKDAAEVAALTEAARRADDAFTEIRQLPFAGRTERQVAEAIAGLLRQRELAIEWGPIVGSGPNGASPHHTASDRVIEHGDLVVLDYGGRLNGYHADMTRTVAVGQAPTGEAREVYELVYQGQERGATSVRPGMTGEQLDSVVRDHLTAGGYGAYFTHRLGHGIGLDTHEAPYMVQGGTTPLAPGMAFSIEPGIYLPGRFGVRIEDIVVVTESGGQRLNHAPRELVVVQ
ncbi:MAG TPA: Xaa-Pro peptidase family protein [Chloroflexia bacterium]|nr:Xaa-Pro peptidase family protein [Chloroflexia bacterium]